ncbi:MAG: flagellin [Asticcacaulis sp.]
MTRVSTSESWNRALLDLMAAQKRQVDANSRVSTTKIATDLQGYGRKAESLTAFNTAHDRIESFIEVGKLVNNRLESQDLALNRVAEGASTARQAIMDALASGNGTGLRSVIQNHMLVAIDGLNSKHHGRYLFSGGIEDTPPVTIETLAALETPNTAAQAFANGKSPTSPRIDETTVIETSFFADDVATGLMQAFKDFADQDTANTFDGPLTSAEKTLLGNLATQFEAAHKHVLNQVAINGSRQNRVESTLKSLESQSISLQNLIGERTDADMAKAYSDLQQAQIAVQATAQVISTLRSSSLLELLR